MTKKRFVLSEEVYSVERVVAHRVNVELKCYEFEVKWEGYPDSDNSWEPFAAFGGDNTVLMLYVSRCRLQVALISKVLSDTNLVDLYLANPNTCYCKSVKVKKSLLALVEKRRSRDAATAKQKSDAIEATKAVQQKRKASAPPVADQAQPIPITKRVKAVVAPTDRQTRPKDASIVPDSNATTTVPHTETVTVDTAASPPGSRKQGEAAITTTTSVERLKPSPFPPTAAASAVDAAAAAAAEAAAAAARAREAEERLHEAERLRELQAQLLGQYRQHRQQYNNEHAHYGNEPAHVMFSSVPPAASTATDKEHGVASRAPRKAVLVELQAVVARAEALLQRLRGGAQYDGDIEDRPSMPAPHAEPAFVIQRSGVVVAHNLSDWCDTQLPGLYDHTVPVEDNWEVTDAEWHTCYPQVFPSKINIP